MAGDRFDKFTERARKVLQLAQEEAQRFNHNYIGTEHLLLGLVREGEGVAAKVLGNLGVELNKVRSAVEFIIGRGDRTVAGDIGLTPRAKKENKEKIAEPLLRAAAEEGGDGRVVLIGIAQEKASTWRSWKKQGQEHAKHPHMEWGRQMAFINHFYFYRATSKVA